MPSTAEASVRGVLTAEQITPGSELARYVSRHLASPAFGVLPPSEKAQVFALKTIEKGTGKFLAPIMYGHFMSVMIFKGYFASDWFSPDQVRLWQADRIERMTQLWGGDPRGDPRELAAKVERYEGILAGVCSLLGVPPEPPDYGALLNKLPNNLFNNT